jgi:hypothetical protein
LPAIKAYALHVAALFEPHQNVVGYEVINEPMPPLTDEAYRSFFNELASALPSGKAVAMPRADWRYRYVGPAPLFVDHASEIQPGFKPALGVDVEVGGALGGLGASAASAALAAALPALGGAACNAGTVQLGIEGEGADHRHRPHRSASSS